MSVYVYVYVYMMIMLTTRSRRYKDIADLNHRYNSHPIHKRGKQLLEKSENQYPEGSTLAGETKEIC